MKGDGTHEVTIEVVRVVNGLEEVVSSVPAAPVEIMPGEFVSRREVLLNVPFPTPGQYQVRVRCGENVGRDTFELEA